MHHAYYKRLGHPQTGHHVHDLLDWGWGAIFPETNASTKGIQSSSI